MNVKKAKLMVSRVGIDCKKIVRSRRNCGKKIMRNCNIYFRFIDDRTEHDQGSFPLNLSYPHCKLVLEDTVFFIRTTERHIIMDTIVDRYLTGA